MLRTWLIGVAILAGVSTAAAAQGPDAEQIKSRQRIFMMEGVLERAVQLGVENLRRQVRTVMPDDALLQGGAPQVRGFRLDGYGVFFDVEVPALRRSLAWSLRTMNETGMALARDVAQLRAFMQAINDPRTRAEFDRMLQRIQRQMAPASTAGPERVVAQAPQTVTAQSLPAATPVQTSATPSVSDTLLADPSGTYTHEVQTALIDAMIEHSTPLALGAEEWLTIAARDNATSDPFAPANQDVVTLVLRVKGSDLLAFRAGRLTLEQVRSRVQVSEF